MKVISHLAPESTAVVVDGRGKSISYRSAGLEGSHPATAALSIPLGQSTPRFFTASISVRSPNKVLQFISGDLGHFYIFNINLP